MKFGRNKSALKSRREGALKRLEAQLTSGIKNTLDYDGEMGGYLTIALSESDRKRIQKEIDILKSRI